jgi:hypothetical protein
VHALDLTTGRSAVVATAPRAVRDVELEAPGLVYSFDTVKGAREVGNLGFLPLARLRAALS